MSGKREQDTLAVVWILAKLGWSNRRIARLVLPSSHHTVNTYYEAACELAKDKKLPIFAKDGRRLRISSVGKSSDVEYIDGKVNHGNCGGGKRVKPHIDDDD